MIRYPIGNASNPPTNGNRFILHLCNDEGKYNTLSFDKNIRDRWKYVIEDYKHRGEAGLLKLGDIELLPVEHTTWVVRCIVWHLASNDPAAQKRVFKVALEECLKKVAYAANKKNASIHFQRDGIVPRVPWCELVPYFAALTSTEEDNDKKIDFEVFVYDNRHHRRALKKENK